MADTRRYWDGSTWTSHITADVQPGSAELSSEHSSRIAQAERLVAALNGIKWVLILLIGVFAVFLILAIANGAFGLPESQGAESGVSSASDGDVDGWGAVAASVVVLALAFVYGLVTWILIGWAQHALSMLAIVAHRVSR